MQLLHAALALACARRVLSDLEVVQQWLEAADSRDGQALERLTRDEFELVGPRGAGLMPRAVLSEWPLRAGFSAVALRRFRDGHGTVVVEQVATWEDVTTGELQDRRVIGSRFLVRDGLVAACSRHDDGLAAALSAAGLDAERDEVTG